jgi:hypothetical protein
MLLQVHFRKRFQKGFLNEIELIGNCSIIDAFWGF